MKKKNEHEKVTNLECWQFRWLNVVHISGDVTVVAVVVSFLQKSYILE